MSGLGYISCRAAVVAAIAAVFVCVATASASAAPLLWTVNSSKESVSTIETGANRVVGTAIPTGGGPTSIAITPNGRRVFVANFAGDNVSVIETATRTPAAPIQLAGHAEQIAISPDGKTAYVTIESNEHVFVVNTETDTISGSIPVAPEASAVAFGPDGKHAYVGTGMKAVSVVETATGKVVGGPIAVGGFPTGIVFTPNGNTAYVAAAGVKGVAVIDTALGQMVKTIQTASEPTDLAVSPNGARLYITSSSAGTVSVAETATNQIVGTPLTVGGEPREIAITPDGKTAYVARPGAEQVTPIELATNTAGTPIALTGAGAGGLVVAPDQSPTAAFTPPSATAGVAVGFDGTASTDPDGTIASYSWSFGDGATASGVGPSHTYAVPGTYDAQLSVVDNEGCGSAEVFTGRTAYCSGGASTLTQPVTVKPAPVIPSNKFSFGRLSHNRRNGTVRLQVRLPAAGSVLLMGGKVHKVTRKVGQAGSMWLTIHARVELNKRLKKIHRAQVRVRVTFSPTGGTARTKGRSLSLLRAAKRKRHR